VSEREQTYTLKLLLASLPFYSKTSAGRVVVLCYHSVDPQTHWRSASPLQFEKQMRWLKRNCDIISLEDALNRAQERERSRPAVVVTFDDGYEDNHTHALPILLHHKIPASFFLAVGLINGHPQTLDRFRAIRQGQVRAMTWEQVGDLRDAGMEIGSHTLNHVNLAQATDATARRELHDSKRAIEDRLGCQVKSIAYPFGIPGRDFSQRTIGLAKDVGYQRGVSILYRKVHRSDDPMGIPRFAIKNNSLRIFEAKVLGKLDVLGRWQERRRTSRIHSYLQGLHVRLRDPASTSCPS
jgi:peptidoglycan/xylan/chitin deacetylase (PgdA/CDA1 family)